jgi:DNA polymerase (family 10)
MASKNLDIARLFDEIADLLELTGQNKFRVNAYHNAARSLRDLNTDIQEIADKDELTDIPGVGASMADHVKEYLENGRIGRHEELSRQIPPTLVQLLQVPGMGPKKAMAVHETLGVKTMDDLKRVLDSGQLARLPGMGEKTAERIRHGMTFLEQASQRVPLGVARPTALALVEQIGQFPGVERVECAGSMRRGMETVGDVDILCSAPEGSDAVERFTKLPQVERVLAAGGTKGSVIVRTRSGRDLQVDLRVVPKESFGAALLYFSGSKHHNIDLREIAIKKGWKLSEYGLYENDKMLAGKTEEQVYKKLGLPWIPPEIREASDVLEAARGKQLPRLVELDEIRGDLHVHTIASDGQHTIEEMARAARDLGYEYLAIADHSKSAAVAHGLSVDDMWEHIDRIRQVGKKLRGLTLLISCEIDILGDGSLDYPDDVLAACDFVTASLHSGFQQPRDVATSRVLAAMDNPYVSSIGHPTGRLIGRREAIDLDMPRIVRAAAETNTALELNAHPERLDLRDQHVRMAIDAGAMIVINTDAHSTADLDLMDYGVITARRGWAQAKDVLNTFTLAAMRKWLDKKRKGHKPARAVKAHATRGQEEIPF